MISNDKAILIVSFGTSEKLTGMCALEQIESRVRDTFPEYAIYRAWTSERIRAKLWKQEQLHINSVSEALEQIKQQGIRNVVIQPTFVIDGEENRRMKEEALAYAGDFLSMEFGAPLLDDDADEAMVARVIAEESDAQFGCSNSEMVVFMGHGSGRRSKPDIKSRSSVDENSVYALVDTHLKLMGRSNMFLRLMNAPEAIDDILDLAASRRPETIVLVPFMIVAGRHARIDMAGASETSWASRLRQAGFNVRCIMKGLGEYASVQDMFIDHIEQVIGRNYPIKSR